MSVHRTAELTTPNTLVSPRIRSQHNTDIPDSLTAPLRVMLDCNW